jgi:hypothetical protein
MEGMLCVESHKQHRAGWNRGSYIVQLLMPFVLKKLLTSLSVLQELSTLKTEFPKTPIAALTVSYTAHSAAIKQTELSAI